VFARLCQDAGGWSLALAVLAACGSGSDAAANAPDASHSVVLGTGEAEFESMDGEPRLDLVHGVQGGFHVWASFLAYGFETAALDVIVTTTVEGAAESLVMHARLSTAELLDADGVPARSFAGFPAQIRDARCADGRRVEVLLQVLDPAGGSAQDARACIAELEEMYRLEDCP
jgi:hypothetical protein